MLNKESRGFRVFGVIVGALFSSLALKVFAQKANLIPSGLTGVSILIQKEFMTFFGVNIPFGPLYLILNILVFLTVSKYIGKRFVMLTFVHIVFTSIFVSILPDFTVTDDVMLLTIFGGTLNGLGISLALKMGGSSGGLDFISIYYSTVKNRPMWHKIMLFNFGLLIYNGWRYNWTLSFYSIIYQFVSTQILSNNHDRYKLSSLRIITDHPQEVADEIFRVVRHGITQFEGMGIYKKKERYMLYTVVNSFEIDKVISAIKCVDEHVFIEISTVDRIEGNFRQKPIE